MAARTVLLCILLALPPVLRAQEDPEPRWLITLADGWLYPADTLVGLQGEFLLGLYRGREQWLPVDSIREVRRPAVVSEDLRYLACGLAGAVAGAALSHLRTEDGSYLISDEEGRMMTSIIFPVIGAAAAMMGASLLIEHTEYDLSGLGALETRLKLTELISGQAPQRADRFPP